MSETHMARRAIAEIRFICRAAHPASPPGTASIALQPVRTGSVSLSAAASAT